MAYFVYRLLPPRPTFDVDATEHELDTMREHVQYWSGLSQQGNVLVFGPVRDTTGAWGLGVIEAESEQDAQAMIEEDPAISSGLGSAELGAMATAVLRIGA